MSVPAVAPQPAIGPPTSVRFPSITRDTLGNGLGVWTLHRDATPVVAILLLIECGTVHDPATRPGLAGLMVDLLDEGAAGRDAIALAEAFAGLGSHLESEVGPDITTLGLTALSRHFGDVLDLLGDVVRRPQLGAADFERVRELRLNRLRQLSRSPSSAAHRAFLGAVFGGHAYGHGALGTSAALDASTLDEAADLWSRGVAPGRATLIAVGDVTHADVLRAARRVFDGWSGDGLERVSASALPTVPDPRVLCVDRPGATQSELRVGHAGPPRATPEYHAIITMNAVLGGQFASRINRVLREERGVTYGARTWFEFRRLAGGFACETSVQSDATAASVAEIVRQFEGMRQPDAVDAAELERARASLTRGYVRNFETPVQMARAAAQLAVHGLPSDTYDAFVPAVSAVTAADVAAAAVRHVRPSDATVVVVGDVERNLASLEALGRPVTVVVPEF